MPKLTLEKQGNNRYQIRTKNNIVGCLTLTDAFAMLSMLLNPMRKLEVKHDTTEYNALLPLKTYNCEGCGATEQSFRGKCNSCLGLNNLEY